MLALCGSLQDAASSPPRARALLLGRYFLLVDVLECLIPPLMLVLISD
jgi:hypothetical protein